MQLLLVAALLAADAKEDVQKLLVGKWETKQKVGERERRGIMEFTADGKVVMKVKTDKGETAFNGTYKLIDEGNIEVSFTVREIPMTDRSRLKITQDTLELTDNNGRVQRFTRLK